MSEASPEVAIRLAMQRQREGRADDAESICREALGRFGQHAGLLELLGIFCGSAGRTGEALDFFQKALKLNPDSAGLHQNLALALRNAGRVDDAIAEHRRAIELKPAFADAHNQLGVALSSQGRLDEAREYFRQAIALKPDLASAHWNYGLLLLSLGEFGEGWREFEWRLKMPRLKLARDFPKPRWTGQDLQGKTILLFTEGGFGDAFQFVRYVPMVADRGAKVILECQGELLPLFKNVPRISAMVSRGESLPAFDYQSPLQSLPLVFGTTLETIPAEVPYLAAPPDRIAKWGERLKGDSSFKVGLVWSGSAGDNARSRTLETFAPLGAIPGVTFYGLQKGPDASQPIPPGMRLNQLGPELGDFADTAAIVANLDLIISVDTGVAHLAGALARPTWVVIPQDPDFRWLRSRGDSPWYPTMRLFRQTEAGSWKKPVEEIVKTLHQRLKTKY
jgi:Tfp pilus assembly protein PilF